MIGGCLRRVFGLVLGLVLLAGLALLAWVNRERITDAWHTWRGEEPLAEEQVSPELAERAAGKLESLARRGTPRRVAFGERELQSLLRYRYASSLPSYLNDPVVRLSEGVMKVHARVAREAMPSLPGTGELSDLLPDTTDVDARAQVLPLDSGRVAIALNEISAARIPLPARMIPSLLRRIGRRDEPGLPGDAIAVRLPAGACTAFVHADSLVLVGPGGGAGCR